jgi:hypothetical protein
MLLFQADWSDVEMDDTWIGLASFNPDQCDLAPMDVCQHFFLMNC